MPSVPDASQMAPWQIYSAPNLPTLAERARRSTRRQSSKWCTERQSTWPGRNHNNYITAAMLLLSRVYLATRS